MIEVLPLNHCNHEKRLLQIGIPKFKDNHYIENSLLGIYYIDLESDIRYYRNISHGDWYQNNCDHDVSPVFSLEKKLLLQMGHDCGIDLNFIIPSTYSNIRFSNFVPSSFRRYIFNDGNLSAIPLVKLFEICELLFNKIKVNISINAEKINSALKMDELFYESLYKTESNIIIKKEENNKVYYSDYNPYTLTNRPTNSSGGINFTALSKKDDTRKHISAGTGNLFVQFDYTAFHPYLISKILNIDIPTGVDYYMHLNEKFKFSTSDSRDQIKEDFFKMIYGYSKAENEFSTKIVEFEKFLMDLQKSSITSFFLKRELFFKDGLNENVLFNYFLQNMETEYNLLKLKQILNNIDQNLAALVLYIYDSFIFRISKNDTDIIKKIELILTNEGFPVKIYIGENLQDLQLIN